MRWRAEVEAALRKRAAEEAQAATRAAAEEARAEAATRAAEGGHGTNGHGGGQIPAWIREARQQLEIWPKPPPKLPPWVKLQTAILADERAGTSDVTVLAALSSFGGATGPDGKRYAWPSLPSIEARSPGLKRTAVITALNRLVRHGYVERFPHGWGRSTLYRFQ